MPAAVWRRVFWGGMKKTCIMGILLPKFYRKNIDMHIDSIARKIYNFIRIDPFDEKQHSQGIKEVFAVRKILAVMLCVFFVFTCTAVSAETGKERIVQINLDTATDEELEAAVLEIEAEQRARIVTKLTLDQSSIVLPKGKSLKLNASVTDIKEGVKLTKTVWSSSNDKVAKVANGNVSAVNGGKAKITCTAVFSDGLELTCDCEVTVVVVATSVSVKEANITLGIGKSLTLKPEIKPDNVTSKKLSYKSEDPTIITVDENGTITAAHGGKTTVVISTTDGSQKTAKVTVYVPSVFASTTDYTVTSKADMRITVDYYGTYRNLSVTANGRAAEVSHVLYGNELKITVRPVAYGNVNITVSDKSDPRSKVVLKVKVDHSAVYDKVSYPGINYNDAARYPSNYRGGRCSFSGQVLQVMNGSSENCYRISSSGSWRNVVYVVLKKSDVTTPIIEDDKVTVYGTYAGNYTYTSIFGASITIPQVNAERINVR